MTSPSSPQVTEPGPADAAAPSAEPGRRLLERPAVQGLAALLIYLAIWVLADVIPLLIHPARPQLFQSSMDPNFYTWSMRWWPFAIGHGLNPLHTTQVSAPAGADLAWVTSVPPLALLAAPLTALAGPVVSFSLLVIASLPASGWAAFVLCRRLTARFWPALVGGGVYGFSGYEINHIYAGQLNLAVSMLLPLMAYLVLLWRDGRIGSLALVCLLAPTMALQFYLFIETFADMTAVWAFALLCGYVVAGRSGRREVARLARLAGLAYLAALVISGPYLAYALTHVPPGFVRSPARTSLDLAGMVVPRAGQTLGLSWLAREAAALQAPAYDGYVSIALIALVVAFAIVSWSSKVTKFLVVTLAAVFLCALGPAIRVDGHQVVSLPWARLWFLPLARSAYPVRFMVFGFLALAVIVALWLASPSRRSWTRWLLAMLAVAAIAADVPALQISGGPGLPPFISSGEYRHVLHQGDTVVVISERGNAGLLWQAETNFYVRLAGGYLNHALAHNSDLPLPVADLVTHPMAPGTVRRFRAFLSSAGISAILVEASRARHWPLVLGRAGLRGRLIGGVIFYPIRG